MAEDAARARAAALPCWKAPVAPRPISGGLTNDNFLVEDAGARFFVRIGDDIPVHHVARDKELAASRAAHAAGIAPEVVYTEPGILVLRYIDGRSYGPEDVRDARNLPRIVELVRRCHEQVPIHLRGPAPFFWVFHVIRDYASALREAGSRHAGATPRYLAVAESLARAIGPVDLVFGHNDLLAANFIDDGRDLWLVDWEYSGFNSPLFDLGGLASNNELSCAQEEELLRRYYQAPVTDGLMRRYAAMKCASLLRESMWSMVSEIHSALDIDYEAYTAENLDRFELALDAFGQT